MKDLYCDLNEVLFLWFLLKDNTCALTQSVKVLRGISQRKRRKLLMKASTSYLSSIDVILSCTIFINRTIEFNLPKDVVHCLCWLSTKIPLLEFLGESLPKCASWFADSLFSKNLWMLESPKKHMFLFTIMTCTNYELIFYFSL